MTIYTRTGDGGQTDLLGGGRVAKNNARLEACGSVDELNAWFGLVCCQSPDKEMAALLEQVQHRLFSVGTELAVVGPIEPVFQKISDADVVALEQAIDRYEKSLPPLRVFILPGGSCAAARLHVARAVCRRAERRVIALRQEEPRAVSDLLIAYMNRLSDLLFVLARAANAAAGIEDAPRS